MFKLVLLVIVAALAIPVVGGVMIRCDGSLDAALERVSACPTAAEALGEHIEPSFLGLTCGGADDEATKETGAEEVSWETPVRGDSARGTLGYRARRDGEGWRVLDATLWLGDTAIPVLPCVTEGY